MQRYERYIPFERLVFLFALIKLIRRVLRCCIFFIIYVFAISKKHIQHRFSVAEIIYEYMYVSLFNVRTTRLLVAIDEGNSNLFAFKRNILLLLSRITCPRF